MRALITGDRGFLGRHFTAELKRRGYDVTGLDVKATISQDCRDFFRRAALRSVGSTFDLVVHCAAVVGGRAAIDGDQLATAESLSIDAEMFRWAAVAKPGRVIYFSSSAAYPTYRQVRPHRHGSGPRLREDGIWEQVSYPEAEMLAMPDQVYGWSKVTGELLAGRLREAGVPVTVVRPFSGYGEDQDETYPFRAILGRVRRREDPLTVWSDAVRDFIHVDDVVAGTLAVADSETEAPVNLCTGRAVSFPELAKIMAETAGYRPAVHVLPGKPTGVAYRVGDPSRMLRFYDPQVSLEEGVRRALGVVEPA